MNLFHNMCLNIRLFVTTKSFIGKILFKNRDEFFSYFVVDFFFCKTFLSKRSFGTFYDVGLDSYKSMTDYHKLKLILVYTWLLFLFITLGGKYIGDGSYGRGVYGLIQSSRDEKRVEKEKEERWIVLNINPYCYTLQNKGGNLSFEIKWWYRDDRSYHGTFLSSTSHLLTTYLIYLFTPAHLRSTTHVEG